MMFLVSILLVFLTSAQSCMAVPGLECDRSCDSDAFIPKHCVFSWSIETHRLCTENSQLCPDGLERLATLVIDEDNPIPSLPALGIHVCRGDNVTVNIENRLSMRDVTMHWHGLHMKGSAWADGVPLVTQCYI